MKINDIINEDGRIVPGVNTTVDVKPGETERQAKKFFGGNGKPKPLGVKGATPNQAFNLGLTEGYKIQLERDPNMYVLHITDTKSGKRTEVRGKSGYESGSYDADDKLHQLLDKIGKSANISELINGEVVTINPKHPDSTKANAAADTAFNEDITQGRNLSPDTEKYIKDNKWRLTKVDVADLDIDAFDDIFNRVIDVDPDHPVNFKDPIVVHADGSTIIDGFHRAYQAREHGLEQLPAYVPESINEHGLVPMYDTMKAYGMKRKTTNGQKHFVLDERKSAGVFQSAALKVLDNLAARKDDTKFPIKFYDGSSVKVSPKTARKFINFYDDAEADQKRWILNYLKTKKGFLELMSPKFVESTLEEAWSKKYKNSIDCNNPKGFSQKAHCAGKKKRG